MCAPVKATTPPKCSSLLVRSGRPADLVTLSSIQAASPEAAQWAPADYLQYDLQVAESADGSVVGFLVTRTLAPGESEILNVAVDLRHRRQGVARALIETWMRAAQGEIFLEVRASNVAAQNLYKSLGFKEFAVRPKYYQSPPETGIVMKFHSC